ncbi:MAG TPA: hypothetical protein VHN39_11670 [Phenylobacterium sp.]|nr:hypothetical protein [Phenylobacterium sp.]
MTVSNELLASLGRRSRLGGVLSLVGVVMVFATLGIGLLQVRDLESHKAQLSKDIDDLGRQKAALSGEVQTLRAKNEDQQDLIGNAQLKIAAGETPAAAKILSNAPAPAAIVKRVYFQARSPDQTPIFQRCARVLLAKGYRVPRLQMVPNTGPQQASIRYFHDGEADEASQLANDLGACAGTDFKVTRIGGYEQSANVKPNQFEVWFSADLTDAAAPPQAQQSAPSQQVQQQNAPEQHHHRR